jgi:uncharacterized protein YigE (DUF2233 family)
MTKISISLIILLIAGLIGFKSNKDSDDARFISLTVDTKKEDLKLYWKNDTGEIINTFENLKTYVESKQKILLFAMNGGMYLKDHSPQGLFIEEQKTIIPLNTDSGSGNFYLKPNGVFYITADNNANVCKTNDFIVTGQEKYATQSGPMLVINGKIHPAFKKGSKNLNIRNGVGILPDNKVLFAMSKSEINFYDFAEYFKNMGCKNALYLDGFVSRTYLPGKNWIQKEGNFGVIIGLTKPLDN